VPSNDRRHDGRYIKASEVETYVFCKRAWQFEQQEAPPTREPERAAGTVYHARHAERVTSAEQTRALARWFLVLGLVLLLLGLLGALR
jgi:hypothetical protein